MKTRISPSLVGLFVLGAAALCLIGLLSFGGVNFFSKPQRFICYFDETIHGLDLGSPVKLRGVRVGRVVDLNVRYDAARNINEVAVVCELSRNMMRDASGAIIDASDPKVLDSMVDKGLRAQLGVLGLATGLLYVELGFYDPAEYPLDTREPDARGRYVPAIPSAISEYQASLSEILSGLKRVDFPGISKEIKGLLVDLRRQVNALETKELIAEWTKAGTSVRELASSPELAKALTSFSTASNQVTKTLENLDTRLSAGGDELQKTLVEAREAMAGFRASAATLQAFVNENRNLGDGAARTMDRIAEAADAIQHLADYLERNPSALLRGRATQDSNKSAK